jgi:hypothetical protein
MGYGKMFDCVDKGLNGHGDGLYWMAKELYGDFLTRF